MPNIIHMDPEIVENFVQRSFQQIDEMEDLLMSLRSRIKCIPWEGGSRELFLNDAVGLIDKSIKAMELGRNHALHVRWEMEEWKAVDDNEAEQTSQTRQESFSWWKFFHDRSEEVKILSHIGKKIEMNQWWEKLTQEEKVAFLQEQHEKIAKELGIKPVIINYKEMDGNLAGGYEPNSNTITLDINSFANDDAYKVVDTIAHETRHKYQEDCINSWVETGVPPDGISEATVKDWQYEQNPENYISASTDLEDYWNQDIEVDSRDFAEKYTDRILFDKSYKSS